MISQPSTYHQQNSQIYLHFLNFYFAFVKISFSVLQIKFVFRDLKININKRQKHENKVFVIRVWIETNQTFKMVCFAKIVHSLKESNTFTKTFTLDIYWFYYYFHFFHNRGQFLQVIFTYYYINRLFTPVKNIKMS